MARFTFKLHALLRQREQIEQQKMRVLGERQKVLVELEQDLRALNDGAEKALSDLRNNHLVGRIDLSFLAAHRRFMGAMGRQAAVILQKIGQAQKQVEEARLALAEAAKNRKAIEKLKERHFAAWQQEQNRKELELLDEVGMQLAFQQLQEDES